ncbi:MAG: hypothetical protein PHN64_08470 [Desulfovibrionaceae bacterium]|nr:hypothetical protein [Desulfovibrionaceae bacterium]
MTYFPKQKFTCDNFTLEVFPFVNQPENVFEDGNAIQYGADFKIVFNRQGKQTNNLRLLQFILPQTAVGWNTANSLNIDKHVADGAPIVDCLYGDPAIQINYGDKYKGEFVCGSGTNSCFP